MTDRYYMIDDTIAEITRLRAENQRLREALEPFAKLAAPLVDDRAAVAIGLTDADFARARAALIVATTPAEATTRPSPGRS